MVDTNRARAKDVVGHVLGSRTFPKQFPKELLELQDYLRLLTECVERFKSVGERVNRGSSCGTEVSGLARSGRWESKPSAGFSKGSVRWVSSIGDGREGLHRRSQPPSGAVSQAQHRAPSFVNKKSGSKMAKSTVKQLEPSAKEPASRVEMSFAVREEQQEPSQVGVIELEPPEEAIVLDDLGRKDLEEDNDSEIGVYYIDEVNRARLMDVIQRELRTLGELCPAAKSNVSEISGEFDHFKGCRKCLNKVSAVLPDLLKEIQELIKYVKKKRNEPYKWPDDSEYLRKNSESAGPPKESVTTRIRQEAVGYVTVEMPRKSRAAQATAQNLKKCSVKMANQPLVSMRQTEAQSELRVLQKLEMLDIPTDCSRNIEYPIEYSSLQTLHFLKADPVYETLHFLPGESKRFLEVLDGGEKKRDFSIDLTDLKGFMLDVQKSQLELQEILLEENEAVQARDVPKAGQADSCEIDILHTMNNARTSVLKTLLKGLGNAWSTHRPQEVASLLQQLQDLYSGSMKDFQWEGFSLPEAGTEFQVQEIPSEGEISKTIYSLGKEVWRERARVCFSEIMGKNSKCEQSRSEIDSEGLLTCEKIEDSSTISGQSSWHTPARSKEKTDPVEATINVTVTIGEGGSRYQSAISMLPSGVTLKGKKSETLFLLNGDDMQVPSVRPLQKCASEVRIPLPGEDGKAMCRAVKTVKKGQASTLTFRFKLPLHFGERARNASRGELSVSKTALHLREGNPIGPVSRSLQKLRSRIRDAEDQMEILKSCADRADLVADRLLSDAYERIDNFRDVSDRCDLLFECLNR